MVFTIHLLHVLSTSYPGKRWGDGTGTEGVNMDKEELDAVECDSEEEEEEGKHKP